MGVEVYLHELEFRVQMSEGRGQRAEEQEGRSVTEL
jgi:hypothetical protein